MRFLLIEDDPAGAILLTEALTTQRYLVNTTDDASTALQLLDAYGYDLVILDMPLEAGIALCRRIRAAGQQMPILMLGMSDEQPRSRSR
jgi:DNA-binding response OmpR family regulator